MVADFQASLYVMFCKDIPSKLDSHLKLKYCQKCQNLFIVVEGVMAASSLITGKV